MRATTIGTTSGVSMEIILGTAMAIQRTAKGRVAVMFRVAEMPIILALVRGGM